MANRFVKDDEIRITHVHPEIKEQLKIIAENYDYTYLNDFLRKELKRIIENTPAEKKIKKDY